MKFSTYILYAATIFLFIDHGFQTKIGYIDLILSRKQWDEMHNFFFFFFNKAQKFVIFVLLLKKYL